MRNKEIENIRKCELCTLPLVGKRSHAKFCNSTCRHMAWKIKVRQVNTMMQDVESTTLNEHQRHKLAKLITQCYSLLETGYLEEFKNRIWAIDSEYEFYEDVVPELEFRKTHNVSNEEYQSITCLRPRFSELDVVTVDELTNYRAQKRFEEEALVTTVECNGLGKSVGDSAFLRDILGE